MDALIQFPQVFGVDPDRVGVFWAVACGVVIYLGAIGILALLDRPHAAYFVFMLPWFSGLGLIVSEILFLIALNAFGIGDRYGDGVLVEGVIVIALGILIGVWVSWHLVGVEIAQEHAARALWYEKEQRHKAELAEQRERDEQYEKERVIREAAEKEAREAGYRRKNAERRERENVEAAAKIRAAANAGIEQMTAMRDDALRQAEEWRTGGRRKGNG